ncbi:hypothetical protein MC885_010594 [Smutsia gigantea]|nr:hypothetical protein MC885_010594 [Smutsia gigantea]
MEAQAEPGDEVRNPQPGCVPRAVPYQTGPLSLQSQILGLAWHTTRPHHFILRVLHGQTALPAQQGRPLGGRSPPPKKSPTVRGSHFPPSLLQAAIPLSSASMPPGARSVQGQLEEALQEPREAQGAEGPQHPPQAVPAIPGSQSHAQSSSSGGDEAAGDAGASLQDALSNNKIQLMAFLLLKYRSQEPTTRAEMLELVARNHQRHFPMIFRQASKGLQLVYGINVKKVEAGNHTYVLVPTLGLTWDGVNEEQSLPKTGFLVVVLSIILLWGGRVPEGVMWHLLSGVGVYPGREHFIYGEPRDLITRVLVQERYLKYRQVHHSNPAHFELLWGPRAHAETSPRQVEQFVRRHCSTAAWLQSVPMRRR